MIQKYGGFYDPSALPVICNYNVGLYKAIQDTFNKQDDIVVIEDPVEYVRKLPDVYIGALGDPGFLNMFRETFQNALDEIIKGNTLDKSITVSFDSRTKMVIIEDNGQGIELDKLAVVFSVLHSSSNYNKEEGSGRYSSGKNGMGGTITNFLSELFIAESYRIDGSAARVEFKEGRLVSEKKIKCPKGRHGLVVTFKPSSMMGTININEIDIENLISIIVPMCNIGTKIYYNFITDTGMKGKKIIENKAGKYQLLKDMCPSSLLTNPISFTIDNGTMKLDVVLDYTINPQSENDFDYNILSFANMCPTSGGTHVEGFLDAIVKYFRDYMNKIYLANSKKKLQITAADIKGQLRAVVSAYHLYPMFTGQSKQIFSKDDMKPFAYESTLEALGEWSKANPNDLQKLCKFYKQMCEARMATEGEKIKMSDKFKSSVITGLPDVYVKPFDDKDFEVYIVEGKSALGGAVNNRDKIHQGLFPLRGKLINAFTTPPKKFFENEEVAGMFKVFGYNGWKKKFNPEDFKPKRVVIMTDADADGSHIRTLIFAMFLVYLPFVIEQGKLFFVEPPLYGLTEGKKTTFFNSQTDYIKFIQNRFCNKNEICNVNTKKHYSDKDLTNIFYKNTYYTRDIEVLSRRYAINPMLLEFLLSNFNTDFKKFKSVVEKNNRFLKVTQENGTTMIRGLYDSQFHTIFVNDRFMKDSSTIIDYINSSEMYYILNGKKCTLYALMREFESFMPPNIQRFKGLGEMKPELLGESTVIPGKGRTLKQYTINDAIALERELRAMQSDKAAFLKGVKITREDVE